MRGGWQGSMGTVGGLTRTYGLQNHFTRGGLVGPPPKINRAGLGRIARYFRPYWPQWLLIFACVIATAGLNVIPPLLVKAILDRAIPTKNTVLLGLLSGGMVGLAMASGLISVLQQSRTARVGQNIMFDLRNDLFRHLQDLSLHFYTSTRSGEIVSRINNDVNAVQGVATNTLVTIASNIAALTATSVTLFAMDWKLSLLAVMVVPAFYLPSRIVGGIRRRLSAQTQQSQAELLAFLNERLHVGGKLLMAIFGQRESDARSFSEKSARLRDLTVRQAVVGRWLFMILSVFSAVGPALIFWYGGFHVIKDSLTPGMLVAFAALLTLLYRPMIQLATVYVDIQASVAVFERIFEYLDLTPQVQDKPQTPSPSPSKKPPPTRGHVAFENVWFSYPLPLKIVADIDPGVDAEAASEEPAERFALREINFQILPGQRVALVGPSGAGKTTITYLLPRFYDPTKGRITLDAQDLRDLPQEQLRRHIGMVTQETFLFHASIRENLLYARPDAGEADMMNACRAANIHDFIASLSEGYDTIAGERGFRLSGGEKQRVSIARALLKNPAILILDEATSSLDATSEYLIQTALEKLLRGRTSLIIAHRLSTILSADVIVVMDAGRVVETGRHRDLLERRGLYAKLFEQQFAKVLESDGRGPAE